MSLVDIAAFRSVLPNGNLLAQELVSSTDDGLLVSGIQKLAQFVIILLTTIKGSIAYIPDFGCQFLSDAELGAWRTVADIAQSFHISRLDISQQVLAAELPTDTPDERYVSLALAGVTLAGNTVTITLRLTNAAGFSYTFATPLVLNKT